MKEKAKNILNLIPLQGRWFLATIGVKFKVACDTFSGLAAHLSRIAAAVATTSGKSLLNSCLFAKIAITLHRRKETDDKIKISINI